MSSHAFEYEGKSYTIQRNNDSVIVSTTTIGGDTHQANFELNGNSLGTYCAIDGMISFGDCSHPEFWNIYQQFESQLIAATTEVPESVG